MIGQVDSESSESDYYDDEVDLNKEKDNDSDEDKNDGGGGTGIDGGIGRVGVAA